MESPTSSPLAEAPSHVADLVARAAARTPDDPAIVDVTSGFTLSWAELDAAVSAEAQRLAREGAGPGDRVVVRLANGAGFCITVLGALRAGAIAVPTGPVAVARELEIILADCSPAVMVAAEGDDVAARCGSSAGTRLLPPPDPAARPSGPVPDQGPRWRGDRAARLHLRHDGEPARRAAVPPRPARQPGPGRGPASRAGAPGGPGAADPPAVPHLRAGGGLPPGVLGGRHRRPHRTVRRGAGRRRARAAPGERDGGRAIDVPGAAGAAAARRAACRDGEPAALHVRRRSAAPGAARRLREGHRPADPRGLRAHRGRAGPHDQRGRGGGQAGFGRAAAAGHRAAAGGRRGPPDRRRHRARPGGARRGRVGPGPGHRAGRRPRAEPVLRVLARRGGRPGRRRLVPHGRRRVPRRRRRPAASSTARRTS